MESEKLISGVTKSTQATGRHRFGVGLIPLGNRKRDAFAFGENVLEERDSVDIASSKRR